MFTEEMWKRSKWLQDKVSERYPKDLVLNHLICFAQIVKEMGEVLDCAPWKFERDLEIKSRDELLEELVDVFKFYTRLLIIHNVTPEEFQKAFNKKSRIVEERLLQGEIYVPDEYEC